MLFLTPSQQRQSTEGILYTVLMKFGYLQKQRYFPVELCPKLWTWKFFRHGTSITDVLSP